MPRQKSTHVDDPAAFGQRLRAAREAAGLSQRQLSGPGLSAAYVSRVEAGARTPSLQLIRRLAERLGVSESYLLTGEEEGATAQLLLDAELALRLNELAEARRLLDKAAGETLSAAEQATLLASRGQLAFREEDLETATAALAAALDGPLDARRRPDAADSLGRAHAMSGRFDESIAVMEKALAEATERQDPLNRLRFGVLVANALIDAGRFGDAEARLTPVINDETIAHDPTARARLYWTQSRLHTMQGQHDLAADYARRALDLLADSEHTLYQSRAYQTLAHIELARGDAREALTLLEQAESLAGGSAAGNFDRGKLLVEQARALFMLGEREEARARAHDAAVLLADVDEYERSRAYLLLGEILADTGDTARALEVYELAEEGLQAAPSRYLAELYERMAELHEREGREREALRLLKKAVQVRSACHGARTAH